MSCDACKHCQHMDFTCHYCGKNSRQRQARYDVEARRVPPVPPAEPVVASRCVEDCQKEGICWFCEWSPGNGFPEHDADCVLVSQGFITPTGERK